MSEHTGDGLEPSENDIETVDERRHAEADPGEFHGHIAATELHWHIPETGRWLTLDPSQSAWQGVEADGREARDALPHGDWRPWERALDSSDAPFFRWFDGGETNACFNEVDRHLLQGNGARIAILYEGDRWDPSKNGGRGGPVFQQSVSYRELFVETVLRAAVLRDLGLERGDRIAFNLPNILEQIYYTEAAKRLGLVYTPVFGGFSAKTLSDRICDAGARVVITADGGYRNAEITPYKETYTDPALDNFVPLGAALAATREILDQRVSDLSSDLVKAVADGLAGEITVERGDVMRELGRALREKPELDPMDVAAIRTDVARRLADTGHIVEQVVVVRHTGQDIVSQARDLWSSDLVERARRGLLEQLREDGLTIADWDEWRAWDDVELWRAFAGRVPALPVPADWPLFIIYTSGSTGKPKGVVHTHGGWLAGIAHTMRKVFGVEPDDRIYVVADPGWITGQAYLIAAPFAVGITSIVAEGSPLFPHAGRFSSIIARHGATIFKAGSTFLKAVMTDPASRDDMARYEMTGLKVATFCAEPVSPAVQRFGMDKVCERYINSYWATEHGGIVFSYPWSDRSQLDADAMTWPLPWIDAEVRVPLETGDDGVITDWRTAEVGEKGELVIRKPYPYLARTIWGDADNLGTSQWRGDLARFESVYFSRWADDPVYTQGDYARRHDDGGFTLHGRSDDVINVSGHRIGTEEIEGAILRDKIVQPDSPLGNAVVVGAPHEEKGETPIAFIIAAPGARIADDDLTRFTQLVRGEKGATAVPSDYLLVTEFPETRSGKYMRRTLRAILLDEPLGDLSTLRNPESVADIQEVVAEWRAFGRLSAARDIVRRHRYCSVETHDVDTDAAVAVLTIDHPPVNSLNERCLDEVNTVVQHLAENERVKAVVVTGARGVFVAGADVKELLEIGLAGDVDSARTPPNAAQTAFSALENLGKPVIAAVNGPALGGGNELVLACTYVVADARAKFGQPEINLHLLPGYGGTQRLPRKLAARRGAAGLSAALRMILGGRVMDAERAHEVGLIDEVVAPEGEPPLQVAVALAKAFAGESGPLVEAYDKQRQRLAAANEPMAGVDVALNDPAVAQTVAQARAGGRAKPVERILEAVKHGADHGMARGLEREAELFAAALCDPESGPVGIQAFLERRSAPLPLAPRRIDPEPSEERIRELQSSGRLLPLDAAFFPGVTPVPDYQYGMGITKRASDGSPAHGEPDVAERLLVLETPLPGPNEALVYVLASEVNFNDIWAITGIPVSPFDAREEDVQITGSGGVGLVARLGRELVREGRLAVGDLVTIYSGQSELLSPDQGLDPMAADFRIQGYERNDGSHAQFLITQGPQLHRKLPSLTLEEAGSYGLVQGTIHRALFTTLRIEPGKRLFVEGAATGTGLECLRASTQAGLDVVGMVSSDGRAQRVASYGGRPIDRKDTRFEGCFTPVPEDPSSWSQWEQDGRPFVEHAEELAGGPIDYVVSHAGELAFSRSFQVLGQNGVLTFFGATTGYRFSFLGKPGSVDVDQALRRGNLRSGRTLMVVYGPGAEDDIVDSVAVQAIELGCRMGARVAVLADSVSQREFVTSLGFGANLAGVVTLEELRRRHGDQFDPPGPLKALPDPQRDGVAFKEAVRQFADRTLKPVGAAIGPLLRNALDARGMPDVILERAGRDGLSLATSLVKPNAGAVVYAEDLGGKRFTFYAPQVWMRQRRIVMPTAEIRGTHLNTAREFAEMQERLASGLIDVVQPVAIPLTDLAKAHQAMWENRHEGATYVADHALPRAGLKTRDDLYRAWALRDAEARGEEITTVDTGSAGTLR